MLKMLFVVLFSLSFPLMAQMDFSDDADTQPVKKETKKNTKKNTKKTKEVKKEEVKEETKVEEVKKEETKTEDSDGMVLGEEATTENKTEEKKEETKTENATADVGSEMSFGEDDVGEAMTFGEEETKSDGKLKQEEMKFDLTESDTSKDKKEVKKEEIKIITKPRTYIEKGVYFKVSYGTMFMLAPKINGKEYNEKDLMGNDYRLSMGFDISDTLSMELFSNFIGNGGKTEGEDNILYSSDLNAKIAGLGFNYNVFNKERKNVHINLHGGGVFIDSSLGMDEIKYSGGMLIGFEYYLLLKHFSMSVFSSFDYITGFDTLSISLAMSIKYSF